MAYIVLLGVMIIIAGVLVLVISTLSGSHPRQRDGREVEMKGGGVVMIGPIPIIFGSDARWTVVAMLLAIVLIVLSLILTRGV